MKTPQAPTRSQGSASRIDQEAMGSVLYPGRFLHTIPALPREAEWP